MVNWMWRDLRRSGITSSWIEPLRSISVRIYFSERGHVQSAEMHPTQRTKHLANVEVLVWDKAAFPAMCIPAVQKMEKENISVRVCVHVQIHTVPVEGKHQFWWSEYWYSSLEIVCPGKVFALLYLPAQWNQTTFQSINHSTVFANPISTVALSKQRYPKNVI